MFTQRNKILAYMVISIFLLTPQVCEAYTFDDVKRYSLEQINEGLAYLTISINEDEKSDDKFAKLWNSAIKKMEEGLDYLSSGKTKDHKEWYRVGQNPKFREIVKEAFEILSVSDAKEKIDHVISYKREIALLYKKNSELVKKEPGAPEKPSSLIDTALDKINQFESKEGIRQQILGNKAKIQQFEQEISIIKDSFYTEMNAKGLEISKEQVESLFSSIDGEGIIAIIGMAQNIKTIQIKLADLAKNEKDNIELLKSYSGIYMMLNETLLFAYQEVVTKIDKTYVPKLDTIIEKAKNECTLAQEKITKTAKHNIPILEANINANMLTIDVGEKYKEYLKRQILFLKREQARMIDNVEVATNTYNTIRNSGELINLINESSADINRIKSFQIPDLEILHEESLRKEFRAITAKLSNEP